MENAQELITVSRRQLIRIVAQVVALVGSVLGLLVLVLVFVLPTGSSLGIYPVLLGIGVAGAVATLYLLPRVHLSYAMLPLVAGMIGCAVAGGLLFSETALVAAMFLTVIAVLISLGQRQSISLPLAALCAIIGLAMAATAPRPALEAGAASLGPALPFVSMAGVGTVIGVTWLIAVGLLGTSDRAVALAEQRAQEAEQARAEAEGRTRELAEQNEAQQHLIALVATLETPAVTVAEGVVLMPLVGHLDTRRSLNLTTRLLETVHTGRVRLVIIDVSGVAVLDTGVIQSLLRTVEAVRLLGAEACLCGIQASTASTIVQLGVDLNAVAVARTPQEAMALRLSAPALA